MRITIRVWQGEDSGRWYADAIDNYGIAVHTFGSAATPKAALKGLMRQINAKWRKGHRLGDSYVVMPRRDSRKKTRRYTKRKRAW